MTSNWRTPGVLDELYAYKSSAIVKDDSVLNNSSIQVYSDPFIPTPTIHCPSEG